MTPADFIYLSFFKQYGLFCFSIIVSSDIQNVVIVWCSCRDSNSENLVFETNAYAISATGTRNTDSSILNMLVLKKTLYFKTIREQKKGCSNHATTL